MNLNSSDFRVAHCSPLVFPEVVTQELIISVSVDGICGGDRCEENGRRLEEGRVLVI